MIRRYKHPKNTVYMAKDQYSPQGFFEFERTNDNRDATMVHFGTGRSEILVPVSKDLNSPLHLWVMM